MADNKTVILDAGHGGAEPGATYLGRQEKNDTLRLTLAVGKLLAEQGVNVVYTRVNDLYQTPYEKADIANRSGADYFISIHRNAMPTPGTASGSETLVYKNSGVPAILAENINAALKQAGFQDLGVIERPGLVVLRNTQMPSVLIEAGFIDNESDNQFFDKHFDDIARAIAQGIINAIRQEEEAKPLYYQVQTGAYRQQDLALRQLNQLRSQGYPAFLVYDEGLYKVRVGAFLNMDYAAHVKEVKP